MGGGAIVGEVGFFEFGRAGFSAGVVGECVRFFGDSEGPFV